MITKEEIKEKVVEIEAILRELSRALVGNNVRVISNYNGQPCGGRSKPSLKGRQFQVESIYFEKAYGIHLFIKGHRIALRLSEVEFV